MYPGSMDLSDPWAPYRDLRSAGTRDLPGQGSCFVAEGRILVEDLLTAGRAGRVRVVSVAGTPRAAQEVRDLLPPGTDLLEAPESELSALAGFPFHRGLLACAQVPEPPDREAIGAASRLLVLPRLHGSENLGLLLRSAAALGLDGVLAGPGPDLWTRRTVRVSMGAVWRIPVWRTEDPWAVLAAWRQAGSGGEVVAAALVPGAQDACAWRPRTRCALVLGPEDRGLAPGDLAHCDHAVAIPMASGMDSLNVAAAGAILMFRMVGG